MVTIDDLTAGRELPEPMVATVTEVDWNVGTSRRAEVTLSDSTGNSLRLVDYEGAENTTNWTKTHQYRISNCKVQRGGGRFNIELSPSKQTQIDPLGHIGEATQILVVGDTHVGRTKHPKTGEAIDPIEAFSTAIDYGIGQHVDAVVHVGDIFHESATSHQAERVDETVFEPLNEATIPFYYIRGNHDADVGNRLLEDRAGEPVVSLDKSSYSVGPDVRVFGLDHDPKGELPWNELPSSTLYDESVSILVLHQTLSQVPEDKLDSVSHEQIQQLAGRHFDAVVVGHHHDASLDEWDGVSVLYTGAAEKMSTNTDSTDRVVWLLTVHEGNIISEKYDIPAHTARIQ